MPYVRNLFEVQFAKFDEITEPLIDYIRMFIKILGLKE